jgi:hypothetical protein
MTLAPVTLEDKYRLEHGRVFLTGVQALTRLPMLQHARDRAAGLNTAGYVSGYRGSPLGGLDQALHEAQPFLAAHHIKFQPGVNEDLAATAVWGTQQLHLFPAPQADGIFAMWYGKGPRRRPLRRRLQARQLRRHGQARRRAADRRRRPLGALLRRRPPERAHVLRLRHPGAGAGRTAGLS